MGVCAGSETSTQDAPRRKAFPLKKEIHLSPSSCSAYTAYSWKYPVTARTGPSHTPQPLPVAGGSHQGLFRSDCHLDYSQEIDP